MNPLLILGVLGVAAYFLLGSSSASAQQPSAPQPYPLPYAPPQLPQQAPQSSTTPPYTLPADGQPGGYATQAEAQAALDASGGGATAVQLSDGRWYGLPYGGESNP